MDEIANSTKDLSSSKQQVAEAQPRTPHLRSSSEDSGGEDLQYQTPPRQSLRRQSSSNEQDLLQYLASSSSDEDQGVSKRRRVQSPSETPDVVFHTATPGYSASYRTPGRIDPSSKYGRVLQESHLLAAKEVEVNWSGRGQHVEFASDEPIPLEVEKPIGHSSTALVESVRCRRIRLARKCIRLHRRVQLPDLVAEVSYLNKLRHPHIVQLVGTYLQMNTFAILLYPVATGDLAKFLDEWEPRVIVVKSLCSPTAEVQRDLARFFFCLSHALDYMHGQGIRHMDIKPSNILVHERRPIGQRNVRSVYLTDFGISRAFTREDGSQTEGPTSMTKRWCSPEVAAQEPRGRASDIFSLGCVFLEMYTVIARESPAAFEDFRAEDGNGDAFHLTLPRVRAWIRKLDDKLQTEARTGLNEQPTTPPKRKTNQFLKLVGDMVEAEPEKRPTSAEVKVRLEAMVIPGNGNVTYEWADYKWQCCSKEPEPYRVSEEDEIFHKFEFDEYVGTGLTQGLLDL